VRAFVLLNCLLHLITFLNYHHFQVAKNLLKLEVVLTLIVVTTFIIILDLNYSNLFIKYLPLHLLLRHLLHLHTYLLLLLLEELIVTSSFPNIIKVIAHPFQQILHYPFIIHPAHLIHFTLANPINCPFFFLILNFYIQY